MSQLTIRSDNEAALQKLQEFLRWFDFEVMVEATELRAPEMPVQYIAQPEFRALPNISWGRYTTWRKDCRVVRHYNLLITRPFNQSTTLLL